MENKTRSKALYCFNEVLSKFYSNNDKTEVDFHDLFLEEIQAKANNVYQGGWYDPPPGGVSIIFADEDNFDRISFETLRKEKYWPNKKSTKWKDNLLFFYCSPVPVDGSEIGDFALTLYFGKDERILRHYWNCFKATQDVLKKVTKFRNSKEIFEASQIVFSERGLQNTVVSYTDVTPLDLGHTFPKAPVGEPRDFLSHEKKDNIRTARKFVNNVSSWEFEEGLQFSIEPQLRSVDDPTLPQITFHYLLYCAGGIARPMFDIDQFVYKWTSKIDVQNR